MNDNEPLGVPMWKWWMSAAVLLFVAVVCGVQIIKFILGG